MTEDAIKEGFEKLKSAEDYKNLYLAGNARAIGDWLSELMLPVYSPKNLAETKPFYPLKSANAYFGNARETLKRNRRFVQKTIGNSKPNTEKWFSQRQLTVYNRQKEQKKV